MELRNVVTDVPNLLKMCDVCRIRQINLLKEIGALIRTYKP